MKSIRHVFCVFLIFSLGENLFAQELPPTIGDVKEFFVKINPAGTYLTTGPGDIAAAPSSLDLNQFMNDPTYGLKAGDLIGLEQVGTFRPGTDFTDYQTNLAGVFRGPAGFLFPGPQSTVQSVFTPNTSSNDIPTDIPQDFRISPNQTLYAQVPVGATEILFSPNDSAFADNTDPDGDFGVYAKIKIIKIPEYRIVKEVKIGGIVQVSNPIKIAPSKLAGCSSNDIKKINIKITCLKKQANGVEVAVAGCEISSKIVLQENGPHIHSEGDNLDHLGKIKSRINGVDTSVAGELISIPETGLIITYEVSEYAGTYSLEFEPDVPGDQVLSSDYLFVEVKIQQNLAPLNDLLEFNVTSHPGDGFFGTMVLRDKLSFAIAQYSRELIAYNKLIRDGLDNEAINLLLRKPPVKSGGASLSWGGAFDINKNWKATNDGINGHCTHRQGKQIDISMRPFDQGVTNEFLREKYKRILALAIEDAELQFAPDESPDNYINHWHAQYK